MQNKTYVIGHVNPDTDSIAAAMGYAWLLRERDGADTLAARAGALNPQTAWVLKQLPFLFATSVESQSPAAQGPPNPVMMQFVRFADIFGSRLVAAFEAIPEAQYSYQPTPTQQTVGYIAQHLEDANYGLCTRLGTAKRPVSAKDSLADTIKARWPKDTLVARLKASIVFCDDVLERLPALESPAVAYTLLAFETDLAEHYAQIASYMRMLGLVPPSAVTPHRRTAIVLPVSTLTQYVGAYEIAPGWELVVALLDNALTIKSSMGGAAAPLSAESSEDFFVNEADAQVTFTRDARGVVTGLVIHQYGRHRPAKKVR